MHIQISTYHVYCLTHTCRYHSMHIQFSHTVSCLLFNTYLSMHKQCSQITYIFQHVPVVTTPCALKFIEYAVVFVEGAELAPKVFVHLVSLDRLRVHVQIPDLQRQIISWQHVTAVVTEFDVGYAGDDLGKEATIGRILRLFKDCKKFPTNEASAYFYLYCWFYFQYDNFDLHPLCTKLPKKKKQLWRKLFQIQNSFQN